jgi:hypothetical protein
MNGLEGSHGWFRIQIGNLDQRLHLVARPRHFGGRITRVGAVDASRRSIVREPREVATDNSQFSMPVDRAHRGKDRINSRLCAIGGLDPSDWAFPPKPNWMRWATYNRAEEKFDRFESTLDAGCLALAIKFGLKI